MALHPSGKGMTLVVPVAAITNLLVIPKGQSPELQLRVSPPERAKSLRNLLFTNFCTELEMIQ